MQSIIAIAAASGIALAVASGGAPHWSYKGDAGPSHWGTVSPEFATCGNGALQSPIDISPSKLRDMVTISTAYRSGDLAMTNNGHTIQASFQPGSTLESGGHRYGLVQVHFHTPSEHWVTGERYPLEAHFVHKDADGKLAVLGIFFKEGAPNAELGKLIANAPKSAQTAHQAHGIEFNPNGLLPHDLKVARYQGSLTTPPCTEGVNWHVAVNTMTASVEQIASLHAIMGDNARPLQQQGSRQLAGK